jgi:hypothetical protein
MNLKMRKVLLAVGTAIMCQSAVASDYPNEPRFDCTAEETKIYIEKTTANLFNPSPIPTTAEFNKGYLEKEAEKAASGDSESASCVSILSDGKLTDEWKRIVETVRNFDFEVSFSSFDGAALDTLLSTLKDKARQEFENALEKLGEDLCNMISTENLESLLVDAVNKKYGVGVRNLRMSSFADALTEDALINADQNILLLLSEDELKSEISGEARSEMRRIRRDLWDNF